MDELTKVICKYWGSRPSVFFHPNEIRTNKRTHAAARAICVVGQILVGPVKNSMNLVHLREIREETALRQEYKLKRIRSSETEEPTYTMNNNNTKINKISSWKLN